MECDVRKKIKLTVLPGDGIGQSVTLSAIPIFEILNVPVDIKFGDIGWEFWKKEGTPIPDRTWELINSSDATLLGAITSKPETEAMKDLAPNMMKLGVTYLSPIIQLRQKLDLFANIRPCFNIKGGFKKFNFCIIRENTEGLYSGFDFHPIPKDIKLLINKQLRWRSFDEEEISCSLRLQSRQGLLRLFNFAFSYAEKENISQVTYADKPNVLRKSSEFSRKIFEEVAQNYPHIDTDILNVDAVALWLVRRPEKFGVIVAENMFGDILSDLGAGVMGGLGFAPSANIGNKGCYFEPVHGSAPQINVNSANPCAMFLTISLLLKHFNYLKEAQCIQRSIRQVLKEGKYLTYDLNGNASTKDFAKAIIDNCVYKKVIQKVSFLATGDEIINGDILETNNHYFAKEISKLGGTISQHSQVSDKKYQIKSALKNLLNESDAVIITGGLGPTSDDNTRFAVSEVIKKNLYFDEIAWNHIVNRLTKFNLDIHESNRQQALFPEKSKIYPNINGTAFGCYIYWNKKHIFMLPGPPKECFPIFNKYVIKKLKKLNFFLKKEIHRWLTIGLIEGEIASKIDFLTRNTGYDTSFRWAYPYLEIKVTSINNQKDRKIINQINETLISHTVSKNGEYADKILKDVLLGLAENIFIVGNQLIQNYIIDLNHPYLFVLNQDENKKNINKFFLKTIVSEFEVKLEVSGYAKQTIRYNHQVSTPNRGVEIDLYIKEYFAWQFAVFIKQVINA